jgi:hypothetical protein
VLEGDAFKLDSAVMLASLCGERVELLPLLLMASMTSCTEMLSLQRGVHGGITAGDAFSDLDEVTARFGT